jgi:hypothetical protein
LQKVNASKLKAAKATFDRSKLTDGNFEDSDFREARFIYSDLSGVNFENSDLREAQFINSDVDDVNLEGAWRLGTDPPIGVLGYIEIILVFLAGESLASLTVFMLKNLDVSLSVIQMVIIIVLGIYSLFIGAQYRKWRRRESSRPMIGPSILMILSIEAAVGLFQLVVGPDRKFERQYYVILIWIICLTLGFAVRYLYYGYSRKDQPALAALMLGHLDLTTIIYVAIPIIYTAAYLLLR